MIIERFKYHEKFCVKSTFLDTSIDVEGTLELGETLQEGVTKAREEMIKALPKHEGGPLPPPLSVTSPGSSVAVIDYGKHDASPDGVLGDIKKSESLEELKSYKLLASTSPELTSAYMNKLKSLSNG